MRESKSNYAFIKHPLVNTLINHPVVYENFDSANRQINFLRDFTISKDSPPEGSGELILWIEGYELTDEESKEGRIGNFALVSVQERTDKTRVIGFTKLNRDIEVHPQKKRPKLAHPDWGHWLLRRIHHKQKYSHIEQAQSDLLRLFKEYPESTRIRNKNCISTIIWAPHAGSRPARKFSLEVVPASDSGFLIVANESLYNNVKHMPKAKVDDAPISPEQVFDLYFNKSAGL